MFEVRIRWAMGTPRTVALLFVPYFKVYIYTYGICRIAVALRLLNTCVRTSPPKYLEENRCITVKDGLFYHCHVIVGCVHSIVPIQHGLMIASSFGARCSKHGRLICSAYIRVPRNLATSIAVVAQPL